MTDRTIFNRTYTQFTPQGQNVFLVNGGLKATASGFNPTISIEAGENIEAGNPLFVMIILFLFFGPLIACSSLGEFNERAKGDGVPYIPGI